MPATPIVAREYDLGNRVKVTATFKVSGTLVDPSIVRFKYKTPAGVITTLVYPTQIVKDAVGIYSFLIELSAVGSWWYRWEAAGDVLAAREQRIQVRQTEF